MLYQEAGKDQLLEQNDACLLSAAKIRCHTTVRSLLEWDGVDVNLKDTDRCMPLSLAVENRHHMIIQLLLGRNKVDVNLNDRYRCTPLSFAGEIGHCTATTGTVQGVCEPGGQYWPYPTVICSTESTC
jgi:ankyrin repeat protein